MDSRFANRHIALAACAATILSAVLFWFGTGLHPVWWITWWAPLPLLLLASRISGKLAFAMAFIAWAAGSCNQWTLARKYLEMPLTTILLMVCGPALIFALILLVWRIFVRRGALVRGVFALAALWVGYEFALQRLSPHSTYGSVAYSQMDCLPILQLASVTGLLGISFLLFLFPASLAALLSGGSRAQKRIVFVAVSAIMAVVVIGGVWRVHSFPSNAPALKVGLIASDVPRNLYARTPAAITETFNQYSSAVRSLTAQGAQIVVLPEKIARVDDRETAAIDSLFGDTARGRATIVVGIEHWTTRAKLNESRIYASDGRLEAVFEKHHMLPAMEGYLLPGKSLTVLREPAGKCGITICKDMDFPALSRRYGNQGVGLQLVSAWDFVLDGWLHSRMAVMRGVESGFSIARSAKQGLLTVSDNRGRVLAQRSSTSADFASLLAIAPIQHAATLYARWGDWFSWLNLVALVLLLASFRWKRGAFQSARPSETEKTTIQVSGV